MNIFEFAIARVWNQLVEESRKRMLTNKEIRLANLLGEQINRYKAKEMAE